MSDQIITCESIELSVLERVAGGAGLVPPAGAVPGPRGSWDLRFGPAGQPLSGSMANDAALRGRALYNEGWNVTRPIVPNTGTPGMLDNLFRLTPR